MLQPFLEIVLHFLKQASRITGGSRCGVLGRGLSQLFFSAIGEAKNGLAELFHEFVFCQELQVAALGFRGRINAECGIANKNRACNFSVDRFQQIKCAAAEGENSGIAIQAEAADRNSFLADLNIPQRHIRGIVISQCTRRLRSRLDGGGTRLEFLRVRYSKNTQKKNGRY